MRTLLFSTVHNNILKSRITEKCFRCLELKLNVVRKFYANVTHLAKIFKLWLIEQTVVLNLYFYIKKKQDVKAFLFNQYVRLSLDVLRLRDPLSEKVKLKLFALVHFASFWQLEHTLNGLLEKQMRIICNISYGKVYGVENSKREEK